MKPEIPSSHQNPEQIPAQYRPKVELSLVPDSPESGLEKGADRYEQTAELSAVTADIGLAIAIPTPVIDDKTVASSTTTDDSPLIANDDDLIEKEWVDKAKKIVSETKNDPHQREKRVSKLQGDYIKKRFGRELGAAE